MKTFFKHLIIDYKIGLRDQSLVLMNFMFPLVFYFFMGGVMGQVNPSYKEYMLPSMLLFSILTSTILIAPNLVSDSREKGIYRSYKIYGVSKLSIFMLIIISNLISVFIVNLIIIITSHFLFDASLPKNWLPLGLAILLFWYASISMAILIGILVKSSKHVVVFSQLIFLPSLLLGGVMIDVSSLPKSMGNVAKIIPSSHAMNIIFDWGYNRVVTMNSFISVVVLILIGVLVTALNFKLFKFDNLKTTKRLK